MTSKLALDIEWFSKGADVNAKSKDGSWGVCGAHPGKDGDLPFFGYRTEKTL
ncbi:MAG: hypothetical protein ACLQT6_15785 [Desulfomonilaceae bacterium]